MSVYVFMIDGFQGRNRESNENIHITIQSFIVIQIIICFIIVLFLYRKKLIIHILLNNYQNDLKMSEQRQFNFKNESSLNWYDYDFYVLPKRGITYCKYCETSSNTK